jgi:hypothetical protein
MSIRKPISLGLPALFALTVAGAVIPAGAQTSAVIVAPSAPPPPQVETIPPPPSDQPQMMTWEPGHWSWNGTTWDWTEGQYVQRPAPAAVWEPGHWAQQASGGYVWIDGRWRS